MVSYQTLTHSESWNHENKGKSMKIVDFCTKNYFYVPNFSVKQDLLFFPKSENQKRKIREDLGACAHKRSLKWNSIQRSHQVSSQSVENCRSYIQMKITSSEFENLKILIDGRNTKRPYCNRYIFSIGMKCRVF